MESIFWHTGGKSANKTCEVIYSAFPWYITINLQMYSFLCICFVIIIVQKLKHYTNLKRKDFYYEIMLCTY